MELIKGVIMKTSDEIYIKLNEIWWDVLRENEDISRFEDEFKTIAMDEGYTREEVDEFWKMGS